ncbi:hypothetical protein KUCAC02_020945, partial [Chaenocephalus aceratus]
DNVDLGELMFSLCYLPTAGRLTITMIKARNLKAMDITGASDPYVKVSLMCEGRRLKKRKTSTKRNTLNPVYNEAIVFDVPPENIDQISLLIAVMDYDRVGHNEVIGVCRVGNEAESLGRDHWSEMLSYPRKPIAHWHPLIEGVVKIKDKVFVVAVIGACSGSAHDSRCMIMQEDIAVEKNQQNKAEKHHTIKHHQALMSIVQ